MTEHKKIPLPEDGDESKTGKSSLFERASGAFGLDSFGSAPMPGKLADAPMKRARPVRRKAAAEQLRRPRGGPWRFGSAGTIAAPFPRTPKLRSVLPSKTHAPATIERANTEYPSPGSGFHRPGHSCEERPDRSQDATARCWKNSAS